MTFRGSRRWRRGHDAGGMLGALAAQGNALALEFVGPPYTRGPVSENRTASPIVMESWAVVTDPRPPRSRLVRRGLAAALWQGAAGR